jgi:8-oxo-dGTP pyrophosphatase MutT (NUDIX family)
MYKVFYNDRTVFFMPSNNGIENKPDNHVHFFKTKQRLKEVIDNFQENQNIKELYIIHTDVEFVFKKYMKFYKLIEAAGGLVKNKEGNLLVIHRREKWDLPKGKMEKKETPEIAALREVEEECGISNLTTIRPINKTYHTYKLGKKDILKKTYWFEMDFTGTQKPIPQTEEEITEVKWINENDLQEVTRNTFPSIIDVLKASQHLK